MIRGLLKTGTLIVLGLWLKPRWKGLLTVILFMIFCWVLHSEYLAYVAHSKDSGFLVYSYIAKWLLLLLAPVFYCLTVERRIAKEIKSKYLFSAKPQGGRDKVDRLGVGDSSHEDVFDSTIGKGQDDGFDFLRKNEKLRRPGEKMLDE